MICAVLGNELQLYNCCWVVRERRRGGYPVVNICTPKKGRTTLDVPCNHAIPLAGNESQLVNMGWLCLETTEKSGV
jgi:hypothetical protein